MHRFLVIIEQGETSYGAYSPDLPGCVAVGKMRGAIEMHIQGMIEDNEPIPVSLNEALNLMLLLKIACEAS